jgi:hypothetical protein
LIITIALTALIAGCSATGGRPREKEENRSSREALFKAVEEVSRPRSIGDYGLLKRQEWALTWAEREMMKKTERGEDWTP